MLKFMEPKLRDGAITPTLDALLKGLLRTLLIVLHDFPDYLAENHLALCNLIPPGCLQLKNLVLSAFPRSKRLPDPFTEGLRLETLPENKDPPTISIDVPAILDSWKLQAPLLKYLADGYLNASVTEKFARRLMDCMKVTLLENGIQNGVKERQDRRLHYNVEILNAVVLYLGMKGIEACQKNEETGVLIFDPNAPTMILLSALNAEFDIEGLSPPEPGSNYLGRYLFLSNIANQLRFPNSHTYYFGCVILELFLQDVDQTCEQITRVLLERIVCNRPHPVLIS
jgi:CCR4-NOT transcription complex subunit 1